MQEPLFFLLVAASSQQWLYACDATQWPETPLRGLHTDGAPFTPFPLDETKRQPTASKKQKTAWYLNLVFCFLLVSGIRGRGLRTEGALSMPF